MQYLVKFQLGIGKIEFESFNTLKEAEERVAKLKTIRTFSFAKIFKELD